MAAARLKHLAEETISSRALELQRLSFDIWSHPEVAFLETHAHRVLTNFLEEKGFHVERFFGLPTAFRATYSNNGDCETPTGPMQLNIGVVCEYDALPTIGHACGHNLIAEAGVSFISQRLALFVFTLKTNKQTKKMSKSRCPPIYGCDHVLPSEQSRDHYYVAIR